MLGAVDDVVGLELHQPQPAVGVGRGQRPGVLHVVGPERVGAEQPERGARRSARSGENPTSTLDAS